MKSLCVGRPRFVDSDLQALARTQGNACAWLEAFRRHGVDAPSRVRGDFAVAFEDAGRRTFLAVDPFAIRTLCYRVDGAAIHVAERADTLASNGSTLEPQALFDYLYFHVIPAPRTVFHDVHRLPAGHCALFENGRLTVTRWWTPRFVENERWPIEALKREFRELVLESVRENLDSCRTGCFLSGGTDSSTVLGMLREATGEAPHAFSIGFDAAGYDEMHYARIAARHFKAQHHEYYVTPDDITKSIPAVAAAVDQPFGNSSVVPAYYCGKLAQDAGITRLLAGDGGDELFGGNTRYAKERVFDVYEYVPAGIRNALLEPLLGPRSAAARLPLFKKAASYVEQARVPMPDRVQIYNLLLRLGVAQVLAPAFLDAIDTAEPLEQQRAVYRSADAHSTLNRTLAYDWKYTLADNDLRKVAFAAELALIDVGFPLLDSRIVDFSLRLPPDLKLRGFTLRWFFKEALRDFLPDEIIRKKKHGFGLPFGRWAVTHQPLRRLAVDSLSSLRARGLLRPGFIDELIERHLPEHPGYYGEMVWILTMLEQWLQVKAPGFRVG